MMNYYSRFALTLSSFFLGGVSAFTVVTSPAATTCIQRNDNNDQNIPSRMMQTNGGSPQRMRTSRLEMVFDPDMSDVIFNNNPFLLSTISADIDNIPTDDFGTVFAGGIMVMLGGVLSALVVGLILDSGDNYSNVVADSYADRTKNRSLEEEDPEFWSQLSPEEQIQARQILDTLKREKYAREGKPPPPPMETPTIVEPKTPVAANLEVTKPKEEEAEKKTTSTTSNNMFSDYDD